MNEVERSFIADLRQDPIWQSIAKKVEDETPVVSSYSPGGESPEQQNTRFVYESGLRAGYLSALAALGAKYTE